MKKIAFFIYFIYTVTIVSGQVYHPLIRPNVFWDNAYWNSFAFCNLSLQRTEFTVGDSLIDGHYYRYQNVFSFVGTPGPGNTLCPPYMINPTPTRSALFREDTLTMKVYRYDVNYIPHDQLLYDFSLYPGDTFQSAYINQGIPVVVNTVFDTILFNGEIRKIFCFEPECVRYFIESIGGCNGLGEPIMLGFPWGSHLLCVKEEETPLWGYECNYQFVSTPEYIMPNIRFFPNSANGKITIMVPESHAEIEIKLLNLLGRQCAKNIIPIGKDQIEMDVINFPSGIYLVLVTDGKNLVAAKKVLLN